MVAMEKQVNAIVTVFKDDVGNLAQRLRDADVFGAPQAGCANPHLSQFWVEGSAAALEAVRTSLEHLKGLHWVPALPFERKPVDDEAMDD